MVFCAPTRLARAHYLHTLFEISLICSYRRRMCSKPDKSFSWVKYISHEGVITPHNNKEGSHIRRLPKNKNTQTMSTEKAARIQTSILNAAEKKALVWLACRQPRWVTSDTLTYIGVAGAFICGLGFALSSLNLHFLWLSSFGLVVNWYGDSLDGTLARVRGTGRPKYGFFIDHSIDAITITMMCVGAGLSPLLRLDVALSVLVAYLIISVYTYVCTICTGEMRLTYGKLGPTEFRLLAIIFNTLFIITPWSTLHYTIGGSEFSLFDLLALGVVVAIAGLWLVQWLIDRKRLSLADPLKQISAEEHERLRKEGRQRA